MSVSLVAGFGIASNNWKFSEASCIETYSAVMIWFFKYVFSPGCFISMLLSVSEEDRHNLMCHRSPVYSPSLYVEVSSSPQKQITVLGKVILEEPTISPSASYAYISSPFLTFTAQASSGIIRCMLDPVFKLKSIFVVLFSIFCCSEIRYSESLDM